MFWQMTEYDRGERLLDLPLHYVFAACPFLEASRTDAIKFARGLRLVPGERRAIENAAWGIFKTLAQPDRHKGKTEDPLDLFKLASEIPLLLGLPQ